MVDPSPVERKLAAILSADVRASNSDMILAHIPLAIFYESEGRHQEGRVLVSEILAVNLNFTAESASQLALLGSAPDEGRASLRRAGLP